jgi:hypothetical protein
LAASIFRQAGLRRSELAAAFHTATEAALQARICAPIDRQ